MVEVSTGQGGAAKVEPLAPEFGFMGGVRPPKDTETTYRVPVFPGSLLDVSISGKPGPENQNTRFCYCYSDHLDVLNFAAASFGATLNGKPVCLDLRLAGASSWLDRQGDSDLKTIRTVCLCGSPQRDLPALARFRDSGVFLAVPKDLPKSSFADYVKAFKEVHPIGLDAQEGPPMEDLLPGSPDLVYLIATGPKLPSIGHLTHLRYLMFKFSDDAANRDVSLLKENPDLRVLLLSGDSKNHRPLENLQNIQGMKNLRSLYLAEFKPEDLAVVGKLRGLQCLDMMTGTVPDFSLLAPLQNLRYLSMVGYSEKGSIDLSPLAQLKNLKVLMVPKGDLEAHKKEYDALRAQRPDIEIVGFCMGSGWILAWLPAGLIAGLAWKRARSVPCPNLLGLGNTARTCPRGLGHGTHR